MKKIITSLVFAAGLTGLSACASDQPDNVGTSSDIVVQNREAVMAGAAKQDVTPRTGPIAGGGKVVSEDQTIDKNPPVDTVVTEDQSVEAQASGVRLDAMQK